MGMSTHVVGYRPPDKKWRDMVAAYNACKAAGIDEPQEVEAFFDGKDPNDLPGMDLAIDEAISKWSDESREGFEVDLRKLPEGLTHIRFYNSW